MLKINKNLEQLVIKKAILKAVRKLSGAAFNKKLNGYQLNFSVSMQINIISMHLNKGTGKSIYCDVFGAGRKSWNYQESLPTKLSEITYFEATIETALAEIFEFVRKDKLIQSGGSHE
jgi:hypothetical protein